jgi:hypothetical protein
MPRSGSYSWSTGGQYGRAGDKAAQTAPVYSGARGTTRDAIGIGVGRPTAFAGAASNSVKPPPDFFAAAYCGVTPRYGLPDCSTAQRRPLSRGFGRLGCPIEPLVSYQVLPTIPWVDPSSTGEPRRWGALNDPGWPVPRERGSLVGVCQVERRHWPAVPM